MERSRVEENGWELCKENIQPLSSGRKMSVLVHSLEGSEHEKSIEQRQRELEDRIMTYEGPDALEPWIHYISFLEQSCPSGGRTKYDVAIAQCFQTFYANSDYKNDKRFIEITIKTVQKVPLERRVDILKAYLDRGLGGKISKLYIAVATDFEALQKYQAASITLKRGIDSDAQPIEDLHEALSNLQHRVAERLAKDLMKKPEEPIRNFGSAVPVCSFSNEAQNVRVALSPAVPCRTNPILTKTDNRSKFPIYQGFDENKEPSNLSSIPQPLLPTEAISSDQENYMKPRRWCDEIILTPVEPSSNHERIQIYVEEPESQPNLNISRKINKRALSERKEVPLADSLSNPPPITEKIMYRKDQLKKGSREITFEHIRAKEYLAKRGLNTVRALLCTDKKIESTTQQQQQQQSVVNNKEVELEKENELLRMKLQEKNTIIQNLESVQKKNSQVMEQQNETIIQVQSTLRDVRTTTEQMKQCFHLRIKELENTIDQEQDVLYKVREEKKELQNALNTEKEKIQQLLKEKEHMRQQFEDEKLKMQQCFDRERNESLLNFSTKLEQSIARQEMEQGLLKIDENSKTVQQHKFNSTRVTVSPPSHVNSNAPKLPFNLYESNMDIIYPETSFARPSSKEFSMPPPQPKAPIRNFEDDKENVGGFCVEKRRRAKSGILQPSTTADPMELIYNEEEEVEEVEDERVLKRQEETGVDFNVTDLTRALEFFPKPLVNSTPEKVSHDITCALPPPRNALRGARKSSLFRNLDIPSSYQDVGQRPHENQGFRPFGYAPYQMSHAPTTHDPFHSDMQPIIYEEDINNQKENSFTGKVYGQSFAQAENLVQNLSPIPETSKERWSGTSSSSSNNMTSTRGAVNYSQMSSYNVTKSVPRPIGRYSGQ